MITQFLRTQKIGKKISLIFIPPLIVIVLGVVALVSAKINDIKQANSANTTVELALLLDGVAHNHAVERGLTAGFLGSQGRVGKEKLTAQRAKADTAATQLRNFIDRGNHRVSDRVAAELRGITKQLSSIPRLRSQVDALDASGKPFQVYSTLNKSALDTIDLLSMSVSDPKIKSDVLELINALWLKERAGQERGALNGVFASGTFSTAKLLSIDAFIKDQDTKLETLERTMSPSDYSALKTTLLDDNNTQVLAYRASFYQAVNTGEPLNEDSVRWFELSTNRIKNIKKVSDGMSAEILASADRLSSAAWATTLATIVLSMLGITALLVFSRLVARELKENIRTVVTALHTIKQNKDFSTRVTLDTEDELSDAAEATNALLDELQRAISSVNKVMSAVASGQFDARIHEAFDGDLAILKTSVNRSAEKVEITMSALADIMDALDNGDFSARMCDDIEGDLKHKVDASMSTLENALSTVGTIISNMSAGDFSNRIDMPLKGALNELKLDVNQSLDNIESAMQEITDVVTKQKDGEFSWRIEGSYQGQLQVLKFAINESMDSIDAALKEIAQVFNFIRDGDYSQLISREMNGDLDAMKSQINLSLTELNAAITEIVSVARSQKDGQLDQRIDGEYKGQLKALKDSLNDSGDALNGAISSISTVMNEVQKGNFSGRINIPLKGVFNQLKDTITSSLQALQRAISDINGIAKAQEKGQLFKRIDNEFHGELSTIKDAINASMLNLSNIVEEVQQSSEHAIQMTNEQSTATHEMSRRTEAQAAALEEIASTMEHIAGSAIETETGCKNISEHVQQAISVSTASLKTVEDTVSSMAEMRESSQRIASITAMIDEIAFQTNLLALNAAVEAARAGDQGRGFAVVATEVRALAQRSGEAARSIKDLIDENVSKVDESFDLVQKSKVGLERITEAVKDSEVITTTVAQSAIAQSTSVSEVKAAISDLDSMTQQNAAMVEETNAATRSVEDQSLKVNSLLGFFELTDKKIS